MGIQDRDYYRTRPHRRAGRNPTDDDVRAQRARRRTWPRIALAVLLASAAAAWLLR